jgi:hypothetical protein
MGHRPKDFMDKDDSTPHKAQYPSKTTGGFLNAIGFGMLY